MESGLCVRSCEALLTRNAVRRVVILCQCTCRADLRYKELTEYLLRAGGKLTI